MYIYVLTLPLPLLNSLSFLPATIVLRVYSFFLVRVLRSALSASHGCPFSLIAFYERTQLFFYLEQYVAVESRQNHAGLKETSIYLTFFSPPFHPEACMLYLQTLFSLDFLCLFACLKAPLLGARSSSVSSFRYLFVYSIYSCFHAFTQYIP